MTSFLTSLSRHLAAELGAKSGADARFALLTPSDVSSMGVGVLLREQEVAGSNPVAPTDASASPAPPLVRGFVLASSPSNTLVRRTLVQ